MGKMYGKYRGRVWSVNDPEKRGRVKCHIVGEEHLGTLDWAEPNFHPYHFFLPSVGEEVWLEFERGDIDRPIWTGWIPTREDVAILNPTYDVNKKVINITEF